jgi:hypothetical protein
MDQSKENGRGQIDEWAEDEIQQIRSKDKWRVDNAIKMHKILEERKKKKAAKLNNFHGKLQASDHQTLQKVHSSFLTNQNKRKICTLKFEKI